MLKGNPSYIEIGEQLANKRKGLDLSLNKVATTLKIRAAYLKAIEEGNINKIPSGMYAAGYIRNYAKFLGVDTTTPVAGEDKSEKLNGTEALTRNFKQTNSSAPGKPLVALSLLIIILVNLIYWLIYR